ncbi:hypothetical protein [Phocaeicola sartorii]|uniref:hypothetical protein n=1 Tax=Phocaeicola sartorii TaxID=671267 RepID=UPI00272DA0B5|nr:hypothetical protein [Phocaeicola sartorii]
MSNEFLVAVVGLIGSLCGSVLGVVGSAKVLTYRVAQLEEKLKKQCENCSVMDGRVDKLESRADVIEERIRTANHRIDNLEKKEGMKL